METIGELIPDLETLLAWVKKNANLGCTTASVQVYIHNFGEDSSKERLAQYARALGKANKDANCGTFWLHRNFNKVEMKVTAEQDTVCTRRVVATKTIPAHVIPEQQVPEKIEEVVEWDCGSILAESAKN